MRGTMPTVVHRLKQILRRIGVTAPGTDPLSESEFTQLVRLAQRVLWTKDRELKRRIQAHDFQIVPSNFYSEIPTVEDVENSFEYSDTQRGPFHSPEVFRPKVMDEFLDLMTPYAEEFRPPLEGDPKNPTGYFWNNPAFSYSDAMMYYCIIRHVRPKKILEVGSGFSTLVAQEALRKNGEGSVTIIEPYPMEFLRGLSCVERLIQKKVQDIPVDELVSEVERADIWFIDSTHTVKNGSDCLYLYLKVMPEISRELYVHSHDIHLPFPFPETDLLERNVTWTEQYLLYAYLLDNPKAEVLFGSRYAAHFIGDALARLMGDKYPGGGASFWYSIDGTQGHAGART